MEKATKINISFSPSLWKFLEDEIARGDFPSAGAYLRSLVRRARAERRCGKRRDVGETTEGSDAYFESVRRAYLERLRDEKSRVSGAKRSSELGADSERGPMASV